ncbi:GNAT family N-acetyltransferase [Komagataeibacter sp. FNDCF1]|uniref:GNAT family N-acetyltransferase n=1 Tax=Komagataeibacter sp. FNDCF1 TaxID=2878681 RepID=UPI001E4CA738|nr:GNAT family N-acetyltransferase [Komagataeibacter sp. FNDCF1]MCE2565598.1 GNAT family N-acetyltransferase [Komagataeibacter sp. FNDCF1]
MPTVPSHTGCTDAAPAVPSWRPMRADDMAGVVALAARLHPLCPEREAVLDERRRLCPEGCLVLPDARDMVGGYMLSHPWRMACPPALDTCLDHLPGRPDCWYLHDIAILPALRGRGATRAALQIMTRAAHALGMDWLALVATEGAGPVWAHLGFVPTPGISTAIIATYGADARAMRRAIAPAP